MKGPSGVPRDEARALDLIRQAAGLEHRPAQQWMALHELWERPAPARVAAAAPRGGEGASKAAEPLTVLVFNQPG